MVGDLLEHNDENVRDAAVAALERLASKGSNGGIRLVVWKMKHSDEAVRSSAVQALNHVAERGDALALKLVSELLVHPAAAIRRTAIDALSVVAPLGDPTAINRLSSRLEDLDPLARMHAVDALGRVGTGDPGVECTMSEALARLDHPDFRVRYAALHAIAETAAGTSDARAFAKANLRL